jgi:hypothetical protein
MPAPPSKKTIPALFYSLEECQPARPAVCDTLSTKALQERKEKLFWAERDAQRREHAKERAAQDAKV